MSKHNLSETKARLTSDVASLVRSLFPNRAIAPEGRGWRIGTHGSLAVRPDGIWCCHESGAGGDIFDLIQYGLATDFKGALAWAKMHTGGRATVAAKRLEHNRLAEREAELARKRKQTAKAKGIWLQAQAPLDWRPL